MMGFPSDVLYVVLGFCGSDETRSLLLTSRSYYASVWFFSLAIFRERFKTVRTFNLPKNEIFVANHRSYERSLASVREVVCFSAALGLIDFLKSKFSDTLILHGKSSGNSKGLVAAIADSLASDGSPAIVLATINKHIPVINFLIERGADINKSDSKGRSALHHAVKRQDASTLGHLINLGADVCSLDDSQRSPLFYAVSGNNECAKLVASALARMLNNTIRYPLQTIQQVWLVLCESLCRASEKGELGFIAAVVEAFRANHGSSILREIVASGKLSPALVAVQHGQLATLKALLALQLVDVNICTASGKTALYLAAEQGQVDTAILLFENGASLDVTTTSDRNPLHAAVEHNHIDVLRVLCAHASVKHLTHRCRKGVSPFMLAENRGRGAMLQVMLRSYKNHVAKNKENAHPYLSALCSA